MFLAYYHCISVVVWVDKLAVLDMPEVFLALVLEKHKHTNVLKTPIQKIQLNFAFYLPLFREYDLIEACLPAFFKAIKIGYSTFAAHS